MKKVIIIIILFSNANISLAQNHSKDKDSCDTFLYFLKSKEELLKYINNPCPNDSNCLIDITKAKSEIARDEITFCMPLSLGTFELRQEKQLRQLCKNYGLNFNYEFFSDLFQPGQTQGCYGLYMDKIIAQKFGNDFKKNLLRQSDSMLVASSPTVYFTRCDTLPHLHGKEVWESTEMAVPINSQLFKKLKISKYGYYQEVDIGFYIDTNGIASGYFLSQFITYDDTKENEKFKKELSKIAVDYLKQFMEWKPGIILNQKVKTEYNTRITFVDENRD